jgi:hypothetical protein
MRLVIVATVDVLNKNVMENMDIHIKVSMTYNIRIFNHTLHLSPKLCVFPFKTSDMHSLQPRADDLFERESTALDNSGDRFPSRHMSP